MLAPVLVLGAGCRMPVLVAGCARGGDRLLVLVLVLGGGCRVARAGASAGAVRCRCWAPVPVLVL